MGAFSAAFSPAFGGAAPPAPPARPPVKGLRLVWRAPEDYRGPNGIRLDGAHRLWRYKRVPTSWTRSILLYASPPRAVFVDSPTQDDANAADDFVLGGTDYRVEDGSWQHAALLAEGLVFEPIGYQEHHHADYLRTDN
jgi:hypothetical protein